MAATRGLQFHDGLQNPPHGIVVSGAMALFAFATCYFRTFIFPDLPLLPSGDQLGFAQAGTRMVAGQLPYRDYFRIVPPGTDLAYALLIRLFGLHTWIPHLVMATLAAMAALFITLISMRVLRGFAVILPGLFTVGFLLAESLDASHHWFSTVTALAALLVLLGGITVRRIAGAGALCGVTACFTQTKGAAVLAGFVVYLLWRASGKVAPARVAPARESWRQCLVLGGMAAGTFAVANAYFISVAGVHRWLYCIVVYPLRYYSAPTLNNWRVILYDFGWHRDLVRWVAFPLVYMTVPLASIVLLVTARRRGENRSDSWSGLVLITLTGIFMFFAVASSPSIKRLGTVGPPDMVSLAWMLCRPGRVTRLLRTGLALGAIGLALALPVRTQMHWRAVLDLPAGRTAFQNKLQYEEYRWVREHTQPGQFFFGMPMYLPFHLVNPAAIDDFDPSEYTRPDQVTAMVQALEVHPAPLMILPPSKKYPHGTGLPSDHLGPIRDYFCRNYSLMRTFETGDEVWERKEAPTECTQQ